MNNFGAPRLNGFTRSTLLDMIIQNELKFNSNGDTGLYAMMEEASTSNFIITRQTSSGETTLFTLTPSGDLTVTGNISFGSLSITGDFTVDTPTFHVDSTNNRVGVGTITPSVPLDVIGGINTTGALKFGTWEIENIDNSGDPTLTFTNGNGSFLGLFETGDKAVFLSDVEISNSELNIIGGDITAVAYNVGANEVLNGTTLGTNVVASSLTSVGTLTGLTVSAEIGVDGVDVTTGNEYQINNVSVLNATTLGSAVVGSSLTSVGTLTSLEVTNNLTLSGQLVYPNWEIQENSSSFDNFEISNNSVKALIIAEGTQLVTVIESLGVGGITPSAIFHALKVKSSSGLDEIMRIEWREESYNQATGDGVKICFYVAEDVGSSEGAYIGVVKTDGTDGSNSTAMVFATGLEGGSVSEAMRIDENGNVGIGDTNPSVALDVVGAINSTTNITTSTGDIIATDGDVKADVVTGEVYTGVCSTIGTLGFILLDEQTDESMGEGSYDMTISLNNQSTDRFATYKVFFQGEVDGDGGVSGVQARFIDNGTDITGSTDYWKQLNLFSGTVLLNDNADNNMNFLVLPANTNLHFFSGEITVTTHTNPNYCKIFGQATSVRDAGDNRYSQNVTGGMLTAVGTLTGITGMKLGFINNDTATFASKLYVRVYRLL